MCELIELKIRLGEILNLLAALGVAVYIHFYIRRKLDDSRHLKNLFIEELKILSADWREAIDIVGKSARDGTPLGKLEVGAILGLQESADLEIQSILIRLRKCYPKAFEVELNLVTKRSDQLWKTVTGGRLMTSNYIATSEFRLECKKGLVKLEMSIHELILLVNSR